MNFMRKVFDTEGDAPTIRRLTKESGIDTKQLYTLIPERPCQKSRKDCWVAETQRMHMNDFYFISVKSSIFNRVPRARWTVFYPALIMANGARMEGIDAQLFFTFFGMDAINNKRMDHLKVPTVGNPAMHMPTVARRSSRHVRICDIHDEKGDGETGYSACS